jgi:hypothetical protein
MPYSSLKRIGVHCFNILQDAYLAVLARGMKRDLARRDAQRGDGNFRWLTPEEAAVAEALARIIVPSDDETPGIDEVGVLGPPAMETLDKLIASSSDRQHLYSRGLLSFDTWALNLHGCKFAELPKEDQTALFKTAQQMDEDWTGGATPVTKACNRLRVAAQAGRGALFASQLYSQIRNDCLQVFYTSRVSWVWLEYDGPPMDKGYPSLVESR